MKELPIEEEQLHDPKPFPAKQMNIMKGNTPIAKLIVVLREEFDDWAVLFNPDTADAVGIHPVCVTTWKHMDGTRTVEEIVAIVRDRFEDCPKTVDEEVVAFIETLSKNGFVGFTANSSD